MAAESAFLDAVATWLTGGNLQPAPVSIGGAEPSNAPGLPAVVVSLEESARAGSGVGERTSTRTGALQLVQQAVNLAQLFPNQLTPDRKKLYLPHGGLVRSDGTDDPLRAADIQVTVNNVAVTFTAGVPAAGQFSASGADGLVTFGTALPNPPATVRATYYVGQWEERVVRIRGVLRIDACGNGTNATRTLGLAVIDRMLAGRAPGGITRLLAINCNGIGSIGQDPNINAGRRQTLRFGFDFEQVVNQPDSAGIIHSTPVVTRLESSSVGPGGVIIETVVQEPPVFP